MNENATPDITQRQKRLRQQLEDRGIRDTRVLDAIERTRRDLFVPEELRDRAYDDEALPIGLGQTISQPYIVALMTESLELTGEETVLEVGTGSGYQAAILAQLCRRVVTVERIEALAQQAQQVLAELDLTNIEFHLGDGSLGVPEKAPYDGIVVTAAAPDVPAPLFRQLKEGGRLVIPVGDEDLQTLTLIRKADGIPVSKSLCPCRFVKLIGDAAWPDLA
ncbi:MAG TPA: protein-L-isoaspartate(D-aspartate) O-methyltransferase [Planctomycetaceae bacterium]|nr:protein-L-isoaspartate(D-aspartate) O-methyltransferase [Planctomycetaceae bacterium]